MHWIDPDCLPETLGAVDLYLLNAEGEADGLVLTDGTEIHFPPHMGGAVLDTVKPGSAVRIRGVRPRGVAMVAAVSVASEAGRCIVDQGPPEKRRPPSLAREPARAARTPIEAEGVLLRGDGFTTEHGTVIAVREVGSSHDDLRRLGARDDRGE